MLSTKSFNFPISLRLFSFKAVGDQFDGTCIEAFHRWQQV
jgi:hypothetical protein